MKNKFVTFLFILLCMGFGINEINAKSIVVGNGISINVASEFDDYSGAPYAVSGSSDRDFAVGIRFSLVTANGTTVMSKDYYYETETNMYVLDGTCNKLMYQNVSTCISNTNWSDYSHWKPISASPNVSQLENIFASQGLNIRVSSGITNGNLSRDYVFGNLFSGTPETNLPKIKNAIDQLFSSVGSDKVVDDFKLPNNTYNLFIEWEPLARIRIRETNGTYHYFYGTTYELSNYVFTFDGFDIGDTNCAGSGNRGYCNFGKAVGKILGCSVFLSSSNSFGQTVSEKIGGNLSSNFSTTSYFGGKMNLNLWNSSLCAEATSSYGVIKDYAISAISTGGVGVIWIGESGEGVTDLNPGCSEVDAYYSNRGLLTPSTALYVNEANSFNFSAFNNYWKTNFNPNFVGYDTTWYRTNCPPRGYDCTPNYNIPSCTSGDNQNLIYSDTGESGKDETYWQKCVFSDSGVYNMNNPHKTSAHTSGGPTYYDSALSSKYCEVYCVEDVIGNLSSNNPLVLAGSHFVWGASSINTVRTCRTKNDSINWGTSSTEGSFYYDLNVANQAVADALAWNKLKDQYNANKWMRGSESYGPGDVDTVTFHCSNCDGIDHCGQQRAPYEAQGYSCGYTGAGVTCEHDFTCTKNITGSYLCTNYTYQDSASVTVAGYTGTATINTTVCSTTGAPTHNPVTGDKLADAKSKVNSVIKEMNKCFTFTESGVLNVNISAHIYYESEGKIYDYDGPMNVNTVSTYSSDTCPDSSTIPVTALDSCSGTSCSDTTAPVKKCDTNVKTGSAMTTLSLEDDVYRFVLKNPDGKTLLSIHGSQLDGYKNNTLEYNWIDVGYSNFPVPYKYTETEYTGALIIKYYNIGHSISGKTSIDKVLESQTGYGTYHGWSCNYTVKPDLIPDDSEIGINVIYREIDLVRPFPDIDASNRDTGANWCDSESCAWNNYVSSTYILNNRGVVGNAVYDKDPMYTFIMTPSDIIKIRKYNDDNEYSAYNGSDGTKTYNFKCSEGTGRGCRSEYLTELMSMLDTANYPGSCKNERGVVDNDTEFNKCRY